jgi:hypothetical protein
MKKKNQLLKILCRTMKDCRKLLTDATLAAHRRVFLRVDAVPRGLEE